jgi:hypothetical protein
MAREIDNTPTVRRNYELFHIIGNRNIVNFIRSQRIKWLGHLYRINYERLAKEINNWKALGTRTAGRLW